MKVTKVNLNVRSGPGIIFPVVEVLPKGRSVDVVKVPPGWVPIVMEDESVCWVAERYLKEMAEEEEETTTEQPSAQPGTSGEPPWITWAKSKLGFHEYPGESDNPDIVPWYGLTTLPKSYWHDSTAWCAVFVNAALMKSGVKTNKSARAFDWLDWGQEVDEPQLGDVVVFDFSHVAFYLSGAGTGMINVIGGNQSDAVTVTQFDEDSVAGYRRPIV